RIAGLEERRDPQRRAVRGCLADAVVGHQDQGTVVGLQGEPSVHPVAPVRPVGDPVPGWRLQRCLEPRALKPATDELYDRSRPLWAVLNDSPSPGFGTQGAEVLELRASRLLGGVLAFRDGPRRSGLSEGVRTGHGQSETNHECDRDDTHWLSPPERARQRGSSVLRIRVSSRTWGQHTPAGAADVARCREYAAP